jgi:PAS domain S-box-containing protein
MISYCGLPLTWPTGEIFGTICILDKKENTFNHRIQPLMARFRDSIQLSLANIYESSVARGQRDKAQSALRESEQQVRRKLDAILSPEENIGALELSDIIDSEKVQKLMDQLYKVTNMGIGIIDIHGKVLVGTGWQDICTQFHRINPESCRLCIESDLELGRDVPVGTFNLYRCKNNMWDMSTPIKLGGQHIGNIFLGQFLFDDETVDYESFRQQARRYGFDEKEYIAALDRASRWSRKTVDAMMSFYSAFAEMIGNLSYGNVKLASALEDRKRTGEQLEESEERYRLVAENFPNGAVILFDHDLRFVLAQGEILSKVGLTSEMMVGKKVIETLPPDRAAELEPYYRSALKGERTKFEYMYGGRLFEVFTLPVASADKTILAGLSISQDITERKQAEERTSRQLEELQRWQDVTLGREDRVRQLKSEVNQLLVQHGEPARYSGQESGSEKQETAKG